MEQKTNKEINPLLATAVQKAKMHPAHNIGASANNYNDGGGYGDGYGDSGYGDSSYGEGPAG